MNKYGSNISALFVLFLALSSSMNAPAVPISSYEGRLVTDATFFGQITRTGSPEDDFWWFFGNAGDRISLTVNRLESALDPAFYLYFGVGSNTSDLTYLAFADDDVSEFYGLDGPFSDPQLLNYDLPYTGLYTVQVWSYASSSPGADGLYDYQITLGTPPAGIISPHQDGNGLQPWAIPEPHVVALLVSGLAGFGLFLRSRTSTCMKK